MLRTSLCATLAVLAACGGDDHVAKPSDDATLDSLSSAEQRGLCDELNDAAFRDADYLDYYCTNYGVAQQSQNGSECQITHDRCLDDPPPLCNADEAGTFADAGCDATVKDYLVCIVGVRELAKEWAGNVTCATSYAELRQHAEAAQAAALQSPPAECNALLAACPDIFE
jgi:hypothetical protein